MTIKMYLLILLTIVTTNESATMNETRVDYLFCFVQIKKAQKVELDACTCGY